MKSQFWSFDIIFAMVIFVFTIIILSYVWYNIGNQLTLASGFDAVIIQTQLQSLNARITSPGSPVDWESTVTATNSLTWGNVSIGLGTGQANNLAYWKIGTLESMSNSNYQATKALLGISYDYYITLSSPNYQIAIGRNPVNSATKTTSIQVATKSVFINGVPANMKIILWTNTTFGVS